MTQMVFITVPSSDLARSRAFYAGLGFGFDDRFAGPQGFMAVVSEEIRLMVVTREMFAALSGRPVAPEGTAGTLVSLSRDSRAAVEAFVAAAEAHGGQAFGEVHDDGGTMYGHSVLDPDGNGLGVMWMDVDAALGAQAGQAA